MAEKTEICIHCLDFTYYELLDATNGYVKSWQGKSGGHSQCIVREEQIYSTKAICYCLILNVEMTQTVQP